MSKKLTAAAAILILFLAVTQMVNLALEIGNEALYGMEMNVLLILTVAALYILLLQLPESITFAIDKLINGRIQSLMAILLTIGLIIWVQVDIGFGALWALYIFLVLLFLIYGPDLIGRNKPNSG